MRRLLIALFIPAFLSALPYRVNFVGLSDRDALKAMFDASDLVTLQARPPGSINGLRYRVDGDIPSLLRTLRAYGYYDATITSKIEFKEDEELSEVFLFIRSGPQYRLTSYEVFHGTCTEPALIACCPPFNLETLGIKHNAPALSSTIVNAELTVLNELARCGYPLAKIEKRRVIVDMYTKKVEAAACIHEGPLATFGPLTVSGLDAVDPRFILRKIAWQEGETYSTDFVEETQKRLLNSGLFSSVMISHDNHLSSEGELPMRLKLSEAKHHQVSVGAFYATVDGPGVNFSWTHRNVRGMGETVNFSAEASLRYLTGILTYKKPDFLAPDQSYRALGQIEKEDIHAYTTFTYRAANYLERKNFSIGLEVEHVNVSHSASNGTYLLLTLPLFAKYSTADDVFNPTRGYTIVYQPHFFQSLDNLSKQFIKQRLTTTFYIPCGSKYFVFAGRIQVGSIAGANQKDVPLPTLFLGGSEDDLRGYRYMTVSPLNPHRKPYGGRSAIFLSAETRIRLTTTLGLVPFADFGNVSFSEWPVVDTKWFKSVGLGLRYFTFFGPIRLDVGFPLDRRKHVDPAFRIYASIGQTF